MSSLHNIQSRANDDFSRLPLHCLGAAQQLDRFNPIELGKYRVQAGDTLYTIARLYYGTDWLGLWTLIADENRIQHPAVLPVGLVLTIPAPRWRNR